MRYNIEVYVYDVYYSYNNDYNVATVWAFNEEHAAEIVENWYDDKAIIYEIEKGN